MGRKTVFVVNGTLGDVSPVLALAVEWRLTSYAPEDDILFICDTPLQAFTSILIEHKIAVAPFINGPGAATLAEHLLQLCTGADMIVFNLFALEGYSLAEKLGVPSVVVSPFLLARPPPQRFEEQLQAIYPELHAHLRAAKEEDGWVTWGHVDCWMWRLFLDDVGAFREVLGLPSAPFLDEDGASKLRGTCLPTPAAAITADDAADNNAEHGDHGDREYAAAAAAADKDDEDEGAAAAAAVDNDAGRVTTIVVPPPPLPPPLLVGVSSTLIPREPYWPQNMVLAGRWSLDTLLQSQPSAATQAAIATLLNRNYDKDGSKEEGLGFAGGAAAAAGTTAASKCSPALICIGFGSMDALNGLLSLEQTKQLACAVAEAVNELIEAQESDCPPTNTSAAIKNTGTALSFSFLIQTCKGTAYDSALNASLAALGLATKKQVVVLSEHVPHDWLFQQQCVAVVSHGGAGTVHSAVAAGVPQVVCPFQFDQFAWAERLSARGLAPPTAPIPAKDLTAKQLVAAIHWTQRKEARITATEAALSMTAANRSSSNKAVEILHDKFYVD